MKLLPSLKLKKRYIVFEIVTKETFTKKEIETAVNDALKDFFGTWGLSKSAPLFIKLKNNKFIIKVNHKFVNECISALILIKKIKNTPVIIKSTITSGTIKKASTKL